MGFSVKFYLDGAISEKNQEQIFASNDPDAKKEIKHRIEKKQLLILVYLRFPGVTIKTSCERKCTQKEWDAKLQEVNPRFYKMGAIDTNKYLKEIKEAIGRLHEKNNNEGIITSKEDLDAVVDAYNNRSSIPGKVVTFETAFEEFIDVKKQKQASSTIITYRTALKHLKNFSHQTKTVLRFKNINAKFESDYRKYLTIELGMENSTIAKNMKILKTFMQFCTDDRDYNPKINTAYKKYDSKKYEKEVHVLTLDELMLLYNYHFTNESYTKVRDVFCFLCFTGLRFSDVEKMKRENINEDMLSILVTKTKDYLTIPLNQYAISILEKYKDNIQPLPVISNQKTNEALHELGKLVGLKSLVKVVNFIGAEAKIQYVPKYDVLTTHMGRKTFITNSLIMNIPERILQEMGAPKHPQSFKRYVAIADSSKKKAMNEAWNEKNILKTRS